MSVRTPCRAALTAALTAAGIAGVVVFAPASQATGTPTLSSFYCGSNTQPYQFMCSVTVGGGTAPYTATWTAGRNVDGFISQGSNGTDFWTTGSCLNWSGSTSVTFTVRDSAGQTKSGTYAFTCNQQTA